jgi:REP element-mobilizing transposase RayT
MGRGIERRKIFLGATDCEDFLGRLEKNAGAGGGEVLAWSLLPNHFHILVRSGETGLPTFMRRLMTGYVGGFNRRHGRHGHLFQNRYKSVVCEEEVYGQELTRYIHLNPLRARIVKTMEELAVYPYTGHSAALGKVERPWQAVEEVLGWFGGSHGQARQRYEEFVAAGVSQGRRPDLVGGGLRRSVGAGFELPRRRRRKEGEEESVYDARVLGSSEFVREVLSQAEWERREVMRRARQGTGLSELGEVVARLTGITTEELRCGGRRPGMVAARRALAQVAIRELGRSGASVARYLGVATSTANRAVEGDLDPLAQQLLETLAAD